MNEWAVLNWFGEQNYALMQWSDLWWAWSWVGIFFLGSLISMSPLTRNHDQTFIEIIYIWIRRIILFAGFVLFSMPFVMLYIYDMTTMHELGDHTNEFITWFKNLLLDNLWMIIPATLLGWTLRFCFNRYILTVISSIARKLRRTQTDEKPSDILDEAKKFKEKVFVPSKHYTKKGLTVGLGEDNKPVIVPWEIWKENMMQIIGPTGFGKGVILGGIAEQCIANGQTFISVNPKRDKFLPYIMFNAANKANRKFYYISLREGEKGSWGPFIGGDKEDAFTRLSAAFKLELTGEPKTDFYKRQELKLLRRAFKRTQRIDGLFNEIVGQGAETAEAELEIWTDYKSLCPASKKGFSIAKAIEENAVVYVQGSLDNRVIKSATKAFISEVIQESRRLWENGDKNNHLTLAIDETSFMVSKVVKEALATIRSYGVTIINAYQSPDDLRNIDDEDIDGRALQHSMNINSQIKAIYGGADYELAEWVSLMSGTTTKKVTKLERTDIKDGGGETWEPNRTIGTLEENLIHPNVLLSLPHKVCIFKQPYELPKVLFTSFVPVSDKKGLDNFIQPSSSSTTKTVVSNENIDPSDDTSKDIEQFQTMANKENKTASSPTLVEKNKEPISHAKLVVDNVPKKNDTLLSSTAKKSTDNDISEEKKREKNKARKERQKAKKRAIKTCNENKQEQTTDNKKVNETDDDLTGFLENVQSDDMTLKSLSENPDDD